MSEQHKPSLSSKKETKFIEHKTSSTSSSSSSVSSNVSCSSLAAATHSSLRSVPTQPEPGPVENADDTQVAKAGARSSDQTTSVQVSAVRIVSTTTVSRQLSTSSTSSSSSKTLTTKSYGMTNREDSPDLSSSSSESSVRAESIAKEKHTECSVRITENMIAAVQSGVSPQTTDPEEAILINLPTELENSHDSKILETEFIKIPSTITKLDDELEGALTGCKNLAYLSDLFDEKRQSNSRLTRTPTFTESRGMDQYHFKCTNEFSSNLHTEISSSTTTTTTTTATRTYPTFRLTSDVTPDDLLAIPPPAYGSRYSRDTEEVLRSDLAACSVKCRRLEEEVRHLKALLEEKNSQTEELSRQLDAHRQEHARQAATIITLRSRLQEGEERISSLQSGLQRSELAAAALTRDTKRQADRIHELEDRLRTQLEEREGAEQRGEASQRKFGELVTTVTSILGVPRTGSPHIVMDTIAQKLSQLTEEASNLRHDKSHLEESVHQLSAATDSGRQTIGRLVNQLDEERRNLAQQLNVNETLRKDEDELRTKLRTVEEELVSLRDRLHSSNKSYSQAMEELHVTEAKFQRCKDDNTLLEHRHHQAEVEWRGVLNTISSLVSAASCGPTSDGLQDCVKPQPEDIIRALQAKVANSREAFESIERMKHQISNLEDQVTVQSELYQAATKRAQRAEEEARGQGGRIRSLEADLHASEQAREDSSCQKDKERNGRLLARLIAALGLQELGDDVTCDPDLVVCRAQQLAKLEGEKITDKTTTVYQLQRKVKALRESVDRKELHLDMLRRKLALNDETAKAAKQVEEEKDDLLARYRRQTRALERSTSEANELRMQVRDLRAQIAASSDYKTRSSTLEERVEELSAKVAELEANKNRHQRKIVQLKEQVRVANEQVIEERRVSDNTLDSISHEVAVARQGLRDATRRERQLLEFRRVVMDLLGMEGTQDECNLIGPSPAVDYETLGRLQRLVSGQREMAQLTRRLDDVTLSVSRPCSAHTLVSRSSSVRSASPRRPESATQATGDHPHNRLPPLDSSLSELNAELRAMTEHISNLRPNVRVLHSSPRRTAEVSSGDKHPSTQPPENDPNSLPVPQTQSSRSETEQKSLLPTKAASYSPSKSAVTPKNSTASSLRQGFQNLSRQSSSASPSCQSPSPSRSSPSPPRFQQPSGVKSKKNVGAHTSRATTPSPILTRPGSGTSRRYGLGRANSVSFLEQDDETDTTTEDEPANNQSLQDGPSCSQDDDDEQISK